MGGLNVVKQTYFVFVTPVPKLLQLNWKGSWKILDLLTGDSPHLILNHCFQVIQLSRLKKIALKANALGLVDLGIKPRSSRSFCIESWVRYNYTTITSTNISILCHCLTERISYSLKLHGRHVIPPNRVRYPISRSTVLLYLGEFVEQEYLVLYISTFRQASDLILSVVYPNWLNKTSPKTMSPKHLI